MTISNQGYAKRVALSTYRQQGRGGMGIIGGAAKDEDFMAELENLKKSNEQRESEKKEGRSKDSPKDRKRENSRRRDDKKKDVKKSYDKKKNEKKSDDKKKVESKKDDKEDDDDIQEITIIKKDDKPTVIKEDEKESFPTNLVRSVFLQF